MYVICLYFEKAKEAPPYKTGEKSTDLEDLVGIYLYTVRRVRRPIGE